MGFTDDFAEELSASTAAEGIIPELYLPTLIWRVQEINDRHPTLTKHVFIDDHPTQVPCVDLISWFRWNFRWASVSVGSYLSDYAIESEDQTVFEE
jgi:hypothetical protein